MHIVTRKGKIDLPLYIPTLTFGGDFPLDDFVRPFLTPSFTTAVMSSYRFIHKMKEQQPPQSFWLDSGAFALLSVPGATWRTEGNGISVIELCGEDSKAVVLHPKAILDKQEEVADVAFTLDIPIPVGCEASEAERRIQASLNNALWAKHHRQRGDLPLFAALPVYTVESTRALAQKFADAEFNGIALGGLVPRRHQHDLLIQLVKAVKAIAPHLPLHLFGMGQVDLCMKLFEAGADSVDSSSWVRYAGRGELFGCEGAIPNPSIREQQHLALMNLAAARQAIFPSSVSRLPLSSWFIRPEWFEKKGEKEPQGGGDVTA